MALTGSFVDSHIAYWEQRLNNPAMGHRSRWPSKLFHHAPIENAVSILRSGELLSREDSNGVRTVDVADPDVIATRSAAHGFARLYFRPRTPTQFRIEGIRKSSDTNGGYQSTHAPILIVFVFSARKILSAQGVCFSDSNMQSPFARYGDDEDFFSTIAFNKVFHEGSIGQDRSIIALRCAEVLVPSPLLIEHVLEHIYCRSSAERSALLYRLGTQARKWRDRIRVSDDIAVFEKRYTFVEQVELQGGGLYLKLHPRFDGLPVSVTANVSNEIGRSIIAFRNDSLMPVPPSGGRWHIRGNVPNGVYVLRIDLEGHCAFQAEMCLDDLPF